MAIKFSLEPIEDWVERYGNDDAPDDDRQKRSDQDQRPVPQKSKADYSNCQSKSSSFDALSFEDRSASSIAGILFTPRLRTFSQCRILRNWGASKAGSKRTAVNATAPRQAVCKASPFAEHDVCKRGKPLVGGRRPLVDPGP